MWKFFSSPSFLSWKPLNGTCYTTFRQSLNGLAVHNTWTWDYEFSSIVFKPISALHRMNLALRGMKVFEFWMRHKGKVNLQHRKNGAYLCFKKEAFLKGAARLVPAVRSILFIY